MLFIVLWLGGAVATACVMAADMWRLGIRQLGFRSLGWSALVAVIGPVAIAIYLALRPSMRNRLLGAAWTLIGDGKHPWETRVARLNALRNSGLIGPAIHQECLRVLEQGLVNQCSDQQSP